MKHMYHPATHRYRRLQTVWFRDSLSTKRQLMIVFRAGTNALLLRRYVWGESCSVAGIPAWELAMISKCANPACNTDFHYLRGGRLYRFDLRHPMPPQRDVPNAICAAKPRHGSVFFWLCNQCSLQYTLHFSTDGRISVLPLQHSRCGAVVERVAEAK